ncbi:DUF1905 domain-containing protein [Tersicoccus sp. Bi-70]|uniref:DUF1905 domain-containing protein n=1 Tax=Tersicoccus sp. Bi-70 TaxID=1897634 RepID=UPI000975B25B|nr:DUF1905 domain-containing protein [Tersicoccus sp. Bi-70]OMH34216.1 hypothetical protein BGP79_03525 [Tersicoccus sp. Bi-70]
MQSRFDAEVWHWRGPAPFHFVSLPPAVAEQVRDLAADVTYGWGMIPARARIGATTWSTAMYAKDGTYALPVKDAVRRAESIDLGDTVTVLLDVPGT